MRKNYARNELKRTGSLTDVKNAMGHKYIETTIRYFMDTTELIRVMNLGVPAADGQAT
jgi:hypothetical protein